MRLIVNESQIKNRTRIGELAPLGGLIILVVATVLIFWKPELTWVTLLIIWVGFILSLVGGYLSSRYLGPMAHHKRVPEVLKGLENSYTLLMYKTPSPFVLVDNGGVTVITVRSQGGQVAYAKGSWRHREKRGWLRRFAGQEGLGRPDRIAVVEVEAMQRYLAKQLPDGVEVPVRSVILFVNPDTVIDVADPPVPVLRGAEFKRWLRREGWPAKLSSEVQRQLAEALGIAS